MTRKVRSPWFDDELKRTVTQEEFARIAETLRSAPGPTPWYMHDMPLLTSPDGSKLVWRDTEEAGTIVLVEDKPNGSAYLALHFYCYVWELDEKTLLIFHQPYVKEKFLAAHFHIIDCSSWNPIAVEGDIWDLERKSGQGDCPLVVKAQQQVVELASDLGPGKHSFVFPEQMRKHEEYLLLMNMTGDRLRMCIARPERNEVQIVPLDWFIDGDFDLGYEWITRIVRNPVDGNIVGEGIRILPFVMTPDGEFIEWMEPPSEDDR